MTYQEGTDGYSVSYFLPISRNLWKSSGLGGGGYSLLAVTSFLHSLGDLQPPRHPVDLSIPIGDIGPALCYFIATLFDTVCSGCRAVECNRLPQSPANGYIRVSAKDNSRKLIGVPVLGGLLRGLPVVLLSTPVWVPRGLLVWLPKCTNGSRVLYHDTSF